MRIERELMRGAGPVAILKLLSHREMYGYELVETLASRTEGVLAMGQSTVSSAELAEKEHARAVPPRRRDA